MGEHRGRLAETHVEREAAAEAGVVEEAEPRQRFLLVAAQLADEAWRVRAGSLATLGGGQQVGGPAPARERHVEP